MISSRLGLDHDRVLGSRYSLPLLSRYLMQRGGHLNDYIERDKLLYWYVHTFLWGRYAGSTESFLKWRKRLKYFIGSVPGSIFGIIYAVLESMP